MSFWGELKRRDVFRVAVAYLVASWLIVQVVELLTNPLGLPDVLDTVVVVLLAIGLPFALIIAWVYEVTPQGIKVTANADTARQAASPSAQRLTYVVTVLLVMAVGIMILDRFVLTPSSGEFGSGSRIAVLPCDDLSPDPTDSFFAVGIHEELLNRLASLSGLEVISRTSVQRYAGARPPVPQIAAELNVDAIIECSARYAGDRVLLTAQLVDAVSDTHLWSQAYPADMSDLQSLFDIQAEIAMDVANTLRIEFFEEEREQLERVPTRSRDAYEFYLAAVELGGRSPTLGSMSRRLELVDAAIELDPEFALAWSLKASTHSNLVQVGPADRIAREQDAAETAALHAIELEPGLGAAYAQLGYTLSQQQKWIEAERAYRRAEELGYENTGGNAYGILLMAAGNFSRAHEVHLIARDIDPLNSVLRAFLIASQGLDEAIDEALEENARAKVIYGEFPLGDRFALWLRLAAGEVDSADDIGLAGPINDAVKPYFDMPARAVEVLQELSVDPAYSEQRLQTEIAIWAGYFGAPEFALEILQELIARNSQNLYAAWFPQMAAMRQLPEFKTLLREVGFLEYWNEFGWPDICRPVSEDDFECD
jgi:adenylate cyclase